MDLQKRESTAMSRRSLIAVALMFGSLSACDGLLDVELPGDITEAGLFVPGMAEMIVLSAMGRVECAFSSFNAFDGAGNADVLWRTTGYRAGMSEYRERPSTTSACGPSGTGYGWYVPTQVGRAMNEKAYKQLTEWTDEEVPDREKYLATTAIYAGFAYQLLGEHFCEMAINVGALMTPDQVLAESERWFTTALQHINSTGDFSLVSTSSTRQMAQLGRARVRIARGDMAGAAEDARQIKPGFIAWITRDNSEIERRNAIEGNTIASIAHEITWEGQTIPFTGYFNLTIDDRGRSEIDGKPVKNEGTPDPRVKATPTGLLVPGHPFEIWRQVKYTSPADDIPLVRWAEAQLILAEIENSANDQQSAVNRVNILRDVHNLPHYSIENPSQVQVRQLILEERRREFFLEGRWWAEKLRNSLWFPRGVGTVPTLKQLYSDGTCMLLPESEYELNPNL